MTYPPLISMGAVHALLSMENFKVHKSLELGKGLQNTGKVQAATPATEMFHHVYLYVARHSTVVAP